MAEDKKPDAKGERRSRMYDKSGGKSESKPAAKAEASAGDAHKTERKDMARRHETERRDMQGNHRDEIRTTLERHEKEHDGAAGPAGKVQVHRKHEHEHQAMRHRHIAAVAETDQRHHADRQAMHGRHEGALMNEAQATAPGQGGGAAGAPGVAAGMAPAPVNPSAAA